MKTTLLTFAGAFIGAVIASYIVPPTLAWYTSPGGLPQGAAIQAVVQIPEVIHYATSTLIRWQLIGSGIGGAVGLVVGAVLGWRGRSHSSFGTPVRRESW